MRTAARRLLLTPALSLWDPLLLLTRLTTAAQPPPLVDPGGEQAATAGRLTVLAYPLVLAVSAHFAPAALVLYWVTSNVVSIAQQSVVNRFLLRPSAAAT